MTCMFRPVCICLVLLSGRILFSPGQGPEFKPQHQGRRETCLPPWKFPQASRHFSWHFSSSKYQPPGHAGLQGSAGAKQKQESNL